MRVFIRAACLGLLLTQFMFQAGIANLSAQPGPARLSFVPSSFPIQAGSYVELKLQVQDQNGKEALLNTTINIDLKSTSPSGRFCVAGVPASISSVTMVTGESSKLLEYHDSAAGSWELTATSEGFLSALGYVTVDPLSLDRFVFETLKSAPVVDTLFEIAIRATDRFGNLVRDFDRVVSLVDLSGTLWPNQSDRFISGEWRGLAIIRKAGLDRVTASAEGKNGSSTLFTVLSGSASKIECSFRSPEPSAPVGGLLDMLSVVTDKFGNPISDTKVSWEIVSTPPGSRGHGLVQGANVTTTTNKEGFTTNVLILGDKPGNYAVVIKELSSFQVCSLTATASPAGDFVISLGAYDPRVTEGGKLTVVIKVSKRGAFNDYVNLRLSPPPANIFFSLTKAREVPDFESEVTITLGIYAMLGMYEMNVTGESSGLSTSVKLSFQIVPAPAPLHVIGLCVVAIAAVVLGCWKRCLRTLPR